MAQVLRILRLLTMQTPLLSHDIFSLKASPRRDPIPAPARSIQPESRPFSQIIKDQQQAKLRDPSPKTPANRTNSSNDLRETHSSSSDRQEIDSANRFAIGGETEKLEDKSADNSSALPDDARHIESQDSQAQDQADAAQSRPAKSAETDNSEAPVEPNDQSKIEDSNQGSNDSAIVQEPEVFETSQSSNETADDAVGPVNQIPQEPIADPEITIDNESQVFLPAEPTKSEVESVSGDQSSSTDDSAASPAVRDSGQEQASSQEVIAEDKPKTNQAQSQLPPQSIDNNSRATNQTGTPSSNESQESTAAQPTQQAQQDTTAATNLPLENQPVQPETRSTAKSNSQVNTQPNAQTHAQTSTLSNTQTNAQINQATQVTVGQDQQQSSTQDKPAGGFSESRTDEPKAKSTTDQQAKLDLPPVQDSTSSRSAASARATQIDAAIRIENATGQPVTAQIQAKPVAQVALGNVSLTNVAQGQTLNLFNSSADSLQDPAHARILRGLTATLNQRGGALTMRLDPPDLGQLRIQMTIVRGIVTANFQVQTPQAQALLERSLATLRSALQGQGLTVERLTVQTTPQQTNTHSARHESDQQASQQRNQHDAGQGESKGRRDEHSQNEVSYKAQTPANEYAAFDLNPQPAGAD